MANTNLMILIQNLYLLNFEFKAIHNHLINFVPLKCEYFQVFLNYKDE
jgi:hypothetical protein